MIVKHKFRYEVGDLLRFPMLAHLKRYGEPIVLVIAAPDEEGEISDAYTVFDFSICQYRHIIPGSYVDLHSQRLT